MATVQFRRSAKRLTQPHKDCTCTTRIHKDCMRIHEDCMQRVVALTFHGCRLTRYCVITWQFFPCGFVCSLLRNNSADPIVPSTVPGTPGGRMYSRRVYVEMLRISRESSARSFDVTTVALTALRECVQ